MNSENLWYKNAVFYQVYVRAFLDSNSDGHGDLPGLTLKLDYLQELGIDCLWLMPIYPSPLLDDGYDIADFYAIHPDYGDLGEFKLLIQAAHQRGMAVILDVVYGHTSESFPYVYLYRKLGYHENPFMGAFAKDERTPPPRLALEGNSGRGYNRKEEETSRFSCACRAKEGYTCPNPTVDLITPSLCCSASSC